MEYSVFELSWSEYGGPFESAGSPRLFGWVRALLLPAVSITDARACVLALSSSGAWVEYSRTVSPEDAWALGDLLARLGLPDRAPRVDGVVDTSDGWSALHVSVSVGERMLSFAVHTESSGFAGSDADALRAVFRRVFALAGFAGYDASLYGGGA
jgi:hypothetical protein